MDAAAYRGWLDKQATKMRTRDRKRGGIYGKAAARAAIHAAVVTSEGRDHWTGEPLDWHLLGTYDNDESQRLGGVYKRQLALLPTIDHRNNTPEADFVICGWRTNDSKHDQSIEELKAFCRMVLEHNQ